MSRSSITSPTQGDRRQANTALGSPTSTIKVNTLVQMSNTAFTTMKSPTSKAGDAKTEQLPSTFTRTRLKRGRQSDTNDYEEFNTLGVFKHMRDEESPTELKMKRTALLLNQNKSFDQYFVEMRRRN